MDSDSVATLRCAACGGTAVEYRIAKAYCVRCGALVVNCCGD